MLKEIIVSQHHDQQVRLRQDGGGGDLPAILAGIQNFTAGDPGQPVRPADFRRVPVSQIRAGIVAVSVGISKTKNRLSHV